MRIIIIILVLFGSWMIAWYLPIIVIIFLFSWALARMAGDDDTTDDHYNHKEKEPYEPMVPKEDFVE